MKFIPSFTSGYNKIQMRNLKINRGVAFFIDINIIALLGIIIDLSGILNKDYISIILFLLLLLKDLSTKNSIGKQLLKIKIHFEKENLIFIKLILRNITLLIWPIEILIVLLFDQRIVDILFLSSVKYSNLE